MTGQDLVSIGHAALPAAGVHRFDRLPRARQPGPACLHGPYSHCPCCCRFCFEDSCVSITDLIILPSGPWEHLPSVVEWARNAGALTDRTMAFGHQRQVDL